MFDTLDSGNPKSKIENPKVEMPPARLERATHSLEGCCSIQLSYESIKRTNRNLNDCAILSQIRGKNNRTIVKIKANNNGKSPNNKIQFASFLNVNLRSFIFRLCAFTHDAHHLFKNFRQIKLAGVDDNCIFGNRQRRIGA